MRRLPVVITSYCGEPNAELKIRMTGKLCEVLWDEDMRDWDGHPVAYDFERHYYTDRSATLEYIGDFTL